MLLAVILYGDVDHGRLILANECLRGLIEVEGLSQLTHNTVV